MACYKTEMSLESRPCVSGFNDFALLLPFAGCGIERIALFKKEGINAHVDNNGSAGKDKKFKL